MYDADGETPSMRFSLVGRTVGFEGGDCSWSVHAVRANTSHAKLGVSRSLHSNLYEFLWSCTTNPWQQLCMVHAMVRVAVSPCYRS